MQLSPSQLNNILDNPVSESPVKIIWLEGKEPLLLQETRDKILKWALKSIEHRQLHQIDQHFNWDQLIAENASFGLFDESKIYDLRILKTSLKADDISQILEFSKVLDAEKFVIISSEKLDKKTLNLKAFKSLQNSIGIMTFWQLQVGEYPRWIQRYAKRNNIAFEEDTLQWLTAQHEGNLLGLQQCLDRIAYTCVSKASQNTSSDNNRKLTIEDIQSSTLFQAQYTTYDLVDIALKANTVKALQALMQMRSQGQEPILILWTLNTAFEALDMYHRRKSQGQPMPWPQFKIFGPRIQLFDRAARRLNLQDIKNGLDFAGSIDAMIKGIIKYDVWQALTHLIIMMSEPQSAVLKLTSSEMFREYTQRA